MVAQVLATHPRVESLIQPFSGTVVHETQWEQWAPGESHPEVEEFVEKLREGVVETGFLASDWFEEHSSSTEMVPGHLHVVKSTKLHFKAKWFQDRFPDIPFWAVYRDPRAVICSLLRNDFYRDWYGEPAYRQIARRVRDDERVPRSLREATLTAESDLERASAIVAVRTEVMFRSVPLSRTLSYEEVVEHPNRTLNVLLDRFNLEPLDFAPALKRDHNLVGKAYEGPHHWRDQLVPEEADRVLDFFTEIGPADQVP